MNYCSVQRCLQDGRKRTGRQADEHSSGQRSFSVRLGVRWRYAYYKIGKGKALSQVIRLRRQHFLLLIFYSGRMVVADWSISSTPRRLPASLDPVTDRAWRNRTARTRADISLSAR